MYQYTEFDSAFVKQRAAQYRFQWERWSAGELSEEMFRPLRLQNGWYVQRYAPMLRVAIPYGDLNTKQLRVLAQIADKYDSPDASLFKQAQAQQDQLDISQNYPLAQRLRSGLGHFSTRQNIQFNWIPLDKSADVMDLLASVNMHGIQTSGNCIRNITSDERAGVAADEIIDPRPYCEMLRQWSTLHPEFAYLPRKFKIAVNGAKEDRAAIAWHDVGLQLLKNDAGEVGFRILVGGGMGRTPITGSVIRGFLPWQQILNYLEALVRTYNQFGRRDNLYKARIKILVKAEGQNFINAVEAEYQAMLAQGDAKQTLSEAELERVCARFSDPSLAHTHKPTQQTQLSPELNAVQSKAFARWCKHNVAAHKNPQLRIVTLLLKRPGMAPGDASAKQMLAIADLADAFGRSAVRVSHEQNVLLPWVAEHDLPALWLAAQKLGLASPNSRLLTDIIACPGGDYCALANARSLPIAAQIMEAYQDLDELEDLGEIDLHISGCINSCGHHHSGHIGILGVDKDGREWYQVSLGGSDGSHLSGPATPGKVLGPSFTATELPSVIEAILGVYVSQRNSQESFIACVHRLGIEPFRAAANEQRTSTRRHNTALPKASKPAEPSKTATDLNPSKEAEPCV